MKKWYESKTVWLSAILTVIGVADFIQTLVNDGALTVTNLALIIGGVASVVLRVWFTDSAIGSE